MAKPGFTVSASTNALAIAKAMDRTAKEQIPFATIQALNGIAKLIKAGEIIVMKQRLDRPSPFTLNGLFIEAARKGDPRKQQARVWFKDYASKGTASGKYLKPVMLGGERGYKKFEGALKGMGLMKPGQFAIPGQNTKLDQYGNVPRSVIVKVMSGLKLFGEVGHLANATNSKRSKTKRNASRYIVAKIGDTEGIWERRKSAFGDGLTPLFVFTDSPPKYRIRVPFHKIAENIVKANYEKEFTYALSQAIKTAR